MLMANGNPNTWKFEDLSPDGGGGGGGGAVAVDVDVDDDDEELGIDIDSLWDLFDETTDASQNGLDDTSLNPVPGGLSELEANPSFRPDFPGSRTFSPSYYSEASDTKTLVSDGSFESAGNSVITGCAKLEPSQHTVSPMDSSSGSLRFMRPPGYDTFYTERDFFSRDVSSYSGYDSKETQFDMANSNATFSFADGGLNHQVMEKSGITSGTNYSVNENSLSISGVNGIDETSFMDLGEIPDLLCGTSNQYPMQNHINSSEQFFCSPLNRYAFENFGRQSLPNINETIYNIKAETEDLPTQNVSSNGVMTFEPHVGREHGVSSEAFMNGNSDVGGLYVYAKGSNPYLRSSGVSPDKTGGEPSTTYEASTHSLPHALSTMSSKKQVICVKDEKNDAYAAVTNSRPFQLMDDVGRRNFSGATEQLYADKGSSPSEYMIAISSKDGVAVKDEKKDVFISTKRALNTTPLVDAHCLDVRASEKPFLLPDPSVKRQRQRQVISMKEERESKLALSKTTCSPPSKNSHQAVEYNASSHRSYLDDDPDICILEDISEPARKNQLPVDGKSLVTAQRSPLSVPTNSLGLGGVRLKTDDERFIFRAALQDLSQPKSEASPPDGLLEVPLLRHQRIALSWMVQKETNSLHCCGGILADDQGLGKTISTIALILKERPTSSSLCAIEMKPKTETLNLDEDDDAVTVLDGSAESCQALPNGNSFKLRDTTSTPAKGRPAAGTLVVCPTSVLRQWADELNNKVSKRANISVLVYHGGNRTKDPLELAKYDVVLTTYSIVSMEVPKQPLVDEDDDETKKSSHFTPVGLSSSKKRKYPPSSNKKSLKGKKGIDGELFESLARPLARVGWFRVVLDEAQSIKNHRTQVARACWGLRAKRRWCLSGTPIQNAIDDLYSYFRFLRYDPYAVYKSFCSTIKVPIQRSPTNGYRKLQAILKTIMLRRTKGTLLDGEPIINLPPKTIELKKVDFTSEERDFYCRLEADSRAQFEEYAAAGTVKQNYVNILLMLLRLRQACDHPLLVQRSGSNNEWRSSLEVAKKLPREKQIRLLNCLEASLAICSLCNDPPEDAVVTSCEHVFCNQCILEHLSGDDNQCPSTNCKTRFSISSVFSRATLRSSLGDQPGQEGSPESSGSISALEPCSLGGSSDSLKIMTAEAEPSSSDDSFDSSKIKAALEVLQSLPKPRAFAAITGSPSSNGGNANSPTNSLNDLLGGSPSDVIGNKSPIVGEKAIVFSQWTRMLDLLEARLKTSSINYRRLDGTMSVHARDKAVKDFNSLPEVSVMIMSLKAASLGLNMVAACHVLLLDLWWNPTTEDQAIDRAHRIGQTRPVTVLRLTVKDTVEDRILALQQKKREMVSSAFGEDEMGGNQTRLTVDDLKYLFMA